METDKTKHREEIMARMAAADPSGTDPNRYEDLSEVHGTDDNNAQYDNK